MGVKEPEWVLFLSKCRCGQFHRKPYPSNTNTVMHAVSKLIAYRPFHLHKRNFLSRAECDSHLTSLTVLEPVGQSKNNNRNTKAASLNQSSKAAFVNGNSHNAMSSFPSIIESIGLVGVD